MSEVIEAVADASENTAENTNISASEFELRRARQMEELIPSEAEPEAEDASISEDIEIESQSNEEEVSEGNEDVLSNIDLENLSEEQIKQLSEALSSRAVDRFGKLTARAKAAEEKAQTLEESLKAQQEEVLSSRSDIVDNPYSDLNTMNDIQDKAKEINDVIDWAEEILFDSDDYSPHDTVTEADGKTMTKAEVREALKQARKSRDKFLPDQFQKVKKTENAVALRQQYGQKALKEFKWLGDKDSEQTKQFVQIAGQPALQKAYEQNPDLSWKLPYLLAHSVDNLFKGDSTKTPKGGDQAFKPSPPKSPSLGGTKSDKSESNSSKALKDLSSRFKESGNKDDFQKLREARWSRNFN
mgnify:CR=1 FL=1